ncbi:MAG: O-antigen ligase family protein [Flavobacteriales bacterium]|jgi:hypothetical protein|nr:O-antigen ligase family protein [Flavobacteriales bacterium]
MKHFLRGKYTFNQIREVLFGVLFLSLLLKESISTFVLMILLLFTLSRKEFWNQKWKWKNQIVSILMILYYLPFLYSYFYSTNLPLWRKELFFLLPFVLLPVAFYGLHFSRKTVRKIIDYYLIGFLLLIIYSLVIHTFQIDWTGKETSVFNQYYKFPKHIRYHYTSFSFAAVCLIYYVLYSEKILERDFKVYPKIVVVSILLIAIILPQSRLSIIMISVGFAIQLVRFIIKYKTSLKRKMGIAVVLSILGVFFAFKISETDRFKQMLQVDTTGKFKDHYDQDIHYNSSDIRLLLNHLAIGVLHEQDAWVFGIGSSNALPVRRAYMKKIGLDKHGIYDGQKFIHSNFNQHNQYFETLLSGGIFQFMVLITLLFITLIKSVQRRHYYMIFTVFAFSLFFLTESLLMKSKGMMLFLILIGIYNAIVSREDEMKISSRTTR